MNLYNLAQEYKALVELAENAGDDADRQAFSDTLEGLQGEIEAKVLNCAAVVKTIDAQVDAIAVEQKRLAERKSALNASIDRLKAYMMGAMKTANVTKIKGDLFTVSIQKNPDKCVLDVQDARELPPRFQKVEVSARISEIKDAIKAGDEAAMKIAHNEYSDGLRIR